jgi:hypothetical protein
VFETPPDGDPSILITYPSSLSDEKISFSSFVKKSSKSNCFNVIVVLFPHICPTVGA